MPKKTKLSLTNLKVQSFVTSLARTEKKAVKGGESEGGLTCNFKCGDTAYWECGNETGDCVPNTEQPGSACSNQYTCDTSCLGTCPTCG